MAKQVRPTKQVKRKRDWSRVWMLLAALVVIAAGCWYGGSFGEDKPEKLPEAKPEVDGSVNYSAQTMLLHGKLDGVLNKLGLKAKDIQEQDKETPRSGGGKISWHNRQLIVPLNGEASVEVLHEQIKEGMQKSGAKLLGSEADSYKGQQALRLDFGLAETLGGEALSIVSDRIYLLPQPGSKAEKQVKQQATAAAQSGKAQNHALPPPIGKGKARLAVVIDDFGYSGEPITAFCSLGRPVTMAVLPNHPHSLEAASRGRAAGQQVILHLPMEPLHGGSSEQLFVSPAQGDAEIKAAVKQLIKAVPGVSGANNHQGSKATGDRRTMNAVMAVLKQHGLFFVDSRTTGQSVAVEAARQADLASGANDLFLDNEDDVAAVKRQLRIAQKVALQQGEAIVIGHARMNTARALREMIPEMEAAGVQFVFAANLLR